MPNRIVVCLPIDRMKPGQLTFYDETGTIAAGPFMARGKGISTATRLEEGGDTPTGIYSIIGIKGPETTAVGITSYGPYVRLVLVAMAGEALAAQDNGRTDIRVHGGDNYSSPLRLKGTRGCIRLFNWDMNDLLNAIVASGIQYPFELEVQDGFAGDYPAVVDTDPEPTQDPNV